MLGFIFLNPASASEQLPGMVVAVEGDPYYFSANDFGIGILQYFERSFDPYLVSGVTDENSSVKEIMDAYNEESKEISGDIIVSDNHRAILFKVHFSNGDIQEKQTFDTFLKFTQINSILSQKGLKLESLLSSENQWYYENIILRSINSGDRPQPFDIDVDVLTGDSSTLQRWQYSQCVVTDYMPYLDENLMKIKFVGSLVSEIRDKTNFECEGFGVDFNLDDADSILNRVDSVPSSDTQAKQIIVEFSGGELETSIPSYSFSKFTPLNQIQSLPVFVPGYSIDDTPRFALESLPSKDKEELYVGISKYILPGKNPEPFDVSVHLTTGNGTLIQTWEYSICSATNYATFFIDNLTFYKFKQTFGSEIRDKTNFECTGLELKSKYDDEKKFKQTFVPDDFERAQTFVVSFESTDISPAKTVSSFTKFSPVTNEEVPILLPNYVFEETPKFYLESLPSKQNQWYYELISKYMNPGAIPEPIKTTISVLAGDGTIIQTWKYKDCEVLEYKPILDDILFKRKFSNEFSSEIRDRTIFECVGFSFDGTSTSSVATPEQDLKRLSYVNFIPSKDDRAERFVVTLSDGDFTEPLQIQTFEKFIPVIEQRKSVVYRVVGLQVAVYESGSEGSSISAATATNSKSDISTMLDPEFEPCDRDHPPAWCDFDDIIEDLCDRDHPPAWCDFDGIEPGEPGYGNPRPPGSPGNPGMPSTPGNPGVPTNPGIEPGEPGYGNPRPPGNPGNPGMPSNPTNPGIPMKPPTSPSYYAAVSEPHFSRIVENEYQKSLRFHLESLSGKDKEAFYNVVSQYYTLGKVKPQPFDVTIDVVTGDGSILQSWEYSKCNLYNFDSYLQDNLLYFTMNGKKATSEIRDKSSFDCVGFSVNFDKNESSYEQQNIILDDSNRALFYIAHLQDGEFREQKSTALVQKINTLPGNNLLLTGLTNVFHEKLYDFVGSYINPGKDPENFDFRYDVVTGDGTILFSEKYSECSVTNFATYYNDQMFYVKFVPSLESEIRSQAILNCVGMDLLVSPQKDPFFDNTGNLKKFSPLTQRQIGVLAEETVCNDGKSIMIRPPKDNAICIDDENVSVFEARGWIASKSSTHSKLSQTLSQPIPTDKQRAEMFLISFEGADISPKQTSVTFSKFVPINNVNSLLLGPSGKMDNDVKQFYLESLPSKDKDWYYNLSSQYINPGKTPESFNVTVEVLAASDDVIQVWNYDSCTQSNYEIFLDENVLTYKFHKKWDAEIKDRSFFSCEGLNLNDSK
jgi:hypothetical protein